MKRRKNDFKGLRALDRLFVRIGENRGLATACNATSAPANAPAAFSRKNFNAMPKLAIAHIATCLNPFLLRIAINEAAPTALIPVVAAINDFAPTTDKEWVRISPYGAFPNKVGLQVFDRVAADEMVSAFNSIANKVKTFFRGPAYYVGHPDDPQWAKDNPNVAMRAVARIKQLEARDDGLWGFVAFNDEGKTLVSGDAAPYAYQSPRWGMRPITHNGQKAFRPVALYSVGLTNNPNIPGNAIGLNEAADPFSTMNKENIAKLLAAIGKPVAADATDEQFAAAINEAETTVKVAVANAAALAGVQAQLATAQNEASTLRGELGTAKTAASNERKARADVALTVAINAGRITEAQRPEWHGKLVAAPDFTAVETELANLKPAVNTAPVVQNLGQRKVENANAGRITAINEAIQKHIKEHGLDASKDYHAADVAVKAAQPALFANAA